MKRNTVVAVALCLMFIATVGGAASSIAGALSSLPGYEDALAAATGTTSGTIPSGSLRSLPGYQEALNQWKGMSGATIYPGTIQRVAGIYCYALTYSDAYQAYTVYLPANEITYAEGGIALPSVIPEPTAVDYVGPIDYYHYTLDFRYQGVYYSAHWYTSCPYTPPVLTVTGTYSPYKMWNDNLKVYDWYWNLHYVATWDASHLPPGVLLQKIDWFIDGSIQFLGSWGPYQAVHGYTFNPSLVSSETIDDGYSWLGCYGPDLCPADEWHKGPPFTAGVTITTIDGNTYTTTAMLTPA